MLAIVTLDILAGSSAAGTCPWRGNLLSLHPDFERLRAQLINCAVHQLRRPSVAVDQLPPPSAAPFAAFPRSLKTSPGCACLPTLDFSKIGTLSLNTSNR